MLFKLGTNTENVHHMLWYYLGLVEAIYDAERVGEMVVTSMRREARGSGFSWHSPQYVPFSGHQSVRAADIRRTALDSAGEGLAWDFSRAIQENYGHALGVVLEPEWLGPEEIERRGGISRIHPHIHIELKEAALRLGWIQ
jgi:hypothetical protein